MDRFAYGPREAPDDTVLVVVSFNIRYGRKVGMALTELRRDPRLNDAAIILLQEMSAAGVDTIARALRMNAVYVPSSVDATGRGFGNAILARAPLRDTQPFPLPHRHPLTGQRRIALRALISMARGEIDVVCVHLETPPLSVEARLEQVAAVAAACDTTATRWLVGGDFNTVDRHEEHLFGRPLRHHGLRRVNTGAEPTVHRYWLGIPIFRGRLDHLFVRELSVRAAGVVAKSDASDHRPIWARLAL